MSALLAGELLAQRVNGSPHPLTGKPIIVFDLYCRMSQGDDGTIYKCEDQEADGREDVADWARERNLSFGPDGEVRIGEVEYDHDRSAWQPGVVRDGFERIMDRVDDGDSSGVWVRDVDRYCRKMFEAVRIADAGAAGGVVLGHTSEFDLSKRKDRKRFLEEAMDAEDESSKISERVKDALMKKAKRGRSLATRRGFARPGHLPKPKGWLPGDPRELVSDEQLAYEVALVRDAAARIVTGTPVGRIATEWNEAGVLTTRGQRWDTGMLRQLLSSPAIAGLAVYQGKVVGELRDTEPVLDRATYDRLVLKFKSQKRGRPVSRYLLSGLIQCGACGDGVLYGKRVYRRDKERASYWCQARPKAGVGCGKNAIDMDFADRQVRLAVIGVLSDSRHQAKVSRTAAKLNSALLVARAELAQLNDEADDFAEKVAANTVYWTTKRTTPVTEDYAKRITEAAAKVAELEENMPEAGSTDHAAEDWDGADLIGQRRMIRAAFPDGLVLMPTELRGKAALHEGRFIDAGLTLVQGGRS